MTEFPEDHLMKGTQAGIEEEGQNPGKEGGVRGTGYS